MASKEFIHSDADLGTISVTQPVNGASYREIPVRPATVGKTLFFIALWLLIMNLIGIYLTEVYQTRSFLANALVYFFDAREEGNIPTLMSTLILFSASVLLFLSYRLDSSVSRQHRKFWLALSVVFLFLTVDESAQVHEQFNKWSEVINDSSGYLFYSWVIPYTVLLIAGGVFFLRFILRLPSGTRNLFILSGGIFISGAVGLELLEGRVTTLYSRDHLFNKLLCAVEEFLEMCGVSVFIYALLDYLALHSPRLSFSVATAGSGAVKTP